MRGRVPERGFNLVGETGEDDRLHVFAFVQRLERRLDGDRRCLLDGIAENAAGDRRKGDALEAVLIGETYAFAVTTGEQFRLAGIAAAPTARRRRRLAETSRAGSGTHDSSVALRLRRRMAREIRERMKELAPKEGLY